MKDLQALFDFIKDETHRHPEMNIVSIMETVDLMESNALPIPLVQVSGNEKGVNLLTAHGAKGLEFEYVFVAGTNSHLWEKKEKNAAGFSFPDTVFVTGATSTDEQELRRLFYVAITRAEKHLVISYPEFQRDGKPLEPSMFISEILQAHILPQHKMKCPKKPCSTSRPAIRQRAGARDRKGGPAVHRHPAERLYHERDRAEQLPALPAFLLLPEPRARAFRPLRKHRIRFRSALCAGKAVPENAGKERVPAAGRSSSRTSNTV